MWPLDPGYPGHLTSAAGKEHSRALETLPRSWPRVLPLESRFLSVVWEVVVLPAKHGGYLILGADSP